MAAIPHDAIVRDAARWFVRMANAPADDPARGRFEAWLLASPRHADEYARFSELWADFDSTTRLERLAQAVEGRRESEAEQQRARAKQRRSLLGFGAVLGLGALLGWRLFPSADSTPLMSMVRSTGRRQTLNQALPDGSRVALAPDSRLAVAYFRTRREIGLQQGEAFFEVARDTQRPFIVSCLQAQVTVLGTKFVVSRLPADAVRVSVVEGQVRVARRAASGGQGGEGLSPELMLVAGDVAELGPNGELRRVDRRAGDALAWQQGSLVFDADPLAEVVQRLSRFSAQPLLLDDDTAAALWRETGREVRITAVVQLRDVDRFIRGLPNLAPVRLQESAGAVHLKPRL